MTRRELWDTVKGAARKAYDEREAGAIAAVIAEELFGVAKADVFLEPESGIPAEILAKNDVGGIVQQLESAVPVQYITGYAYFLGRKFHVRTGVLVPRPETEALVEWIAADAAANSIPNITGDIAAANSAAVEAGAVEKPCRILDIGTGSGCIAVSLAAMLPDAEVSAIDVSRTALKIAKENAASNGVEVKFSQTDILESVPAGIYDIIVSNPPYVRQSEKEFMPANVLRHEPAEALFVDDADPLLFYRVIAQKGKRMLGDGGLLYFEINEAFGRETLALLLGEGYLGVELRNDIFGKPRMVKAWLS